jgi:hypothetical protein
LGYLAVVENGGEVQASSGDDLGGVAVLDEAAGEVERSAASFQMRESSDARKKMTGG